MNVYEQLQKLIEQENSQDTLKEILKELKEIKKILLNSAKQKYPKQNNQQEYYDFIYKLRKKFRNNIQNNINIEIIYKNQKLGINQRGWMYDKETLLELSAKEAFKVYQYLYQNRESLENLIKISV